jgi:hypothetical protein
MSAVHTPNLPAQTAPVPALPADRRRFVFERDSFAFANELAWEYRHDSKTGRTTTIERRPRPGYTLRCFVLTAATRQFFFHADFDGSRPRLDAAEYGLLVRRVVARSPRHRAAPGERIRIPGYDGLRHFSRDFESLLKEECGGAWRSYVLRSHWRMVFPISRRNQARTAERLQTTLLRDGTAVVHLVRFPKLTINHGVVLYGSRPVAEGIAFDVYDPNDPGKPSLLTYHSAYRSFQFPANAYWAGGELDVIEIYRNWFI